MKMVLSTILAALLVGLLPAAPAKAANAVSFVSSTGTSTICTRVAPCGDFQTAQDATLVEGEIRCLDSGPFGAIGSNPTTINKSITIDCANTGAVAMGGFFVVNAPGYVVRIRNLSFNGQSGGVGIDFQNGTALIVENCIIQNFSHASPFVGIRFRPSTSGSELVVSDTAFNDNGSGLSGGPGLIGGAIDIIPASGVTAQVTLSRVTVTMNTHGIIADGTAGGSIRGVVRDSVVSGNVNNGITVTSGAGAAVLSVQNTTVSGNNFGLVAGGASGGMLVSHSSIVLNNNGLFTTGGGALYSYGNNSVNGNTAGETFTATIGQK